MIAGAILLSIKIASLGLIPVLIIFLALTAGGVGNLIVVVAAKTPISKAAVLFFGALKDLPKNTENHPSSPTVN